MKIRKDARKIINYWKRKFRILEDWKINYAPKAPYKAQCCHNRKNKSSTIYAWPDGKRIPEDYYFHEVLHVAFAAYRSSKKHDREELLVQDLCVIYGSNRRNRLRA
jgi:hypothetical protein